MISLRYNSRNWQIWLLFAILASFGRSRVLAQDPPKAKKGLRDIAGDDSAIAELIDGVLVVIRLDGHVREFDLRPKNFFTVSHFSADGTKIVGLRGLRIVVLNTNLAVEWEQPTSMTGVRSLALSPDGIRVILAATDEQNRTVRLCVVSSSGTEKIVEAFSSYGDDPDGSWVLSWDPQGERVVFGAKGQVQVLDLQTRTTRSMAAGLDPAWSPNGKWIAYRTTKGRLKLLDLASGSATTLTANVLSMAHWAPDSKYVFVDENYPDRSNHGCFDSSRFVVCRVSDGACKAVYDPCGLRDWCFGWISNATRWIRAAESTEIDLKKTGRNR